MGHQESHWTVRVVTWETAEQGLTAPTDAYPVLRSRGKEGGYGWVEDRLMFPDRLTEEEARQAVAELQAAGAVAWVLLIRAHATCTTRRKPSRVRPDGREIAGREKLRHLLGGIGR